LKRTPKIISILKNQGIKHQDKWNNVYWFIGKVANYMVTFYAGGGICVESISDG